MSDSILLDVAAGEPTAVQACIRRFSGSVLSLARRYCATEQDAEDAVQDIFLDVWKSASRFDPRAGSDLTFVMTIARRRLIDRTRRVGRAPSIQSLPEPEAIVDAPVPDAAEVSDELARVREAMGRLGAKQREVLQMSLVQGHTHQQVAERTGLPLGTVKSHARRGLMRIRDMLAASSSGSANGDRS